jgi:pSer/pThr/pTyr-binding forkhead associated (FHA) protein
MIVELIPTDPAQQTVVVDNLPAILGSGEEADLRVDDADVSNLHCIIDRVARRLVVTDLVSRSGTFVNDDRVLDSPLMPGDMLSIGGTTYVVRYEPAAEPEPWWAEQVRE